MPPLPPLLVLLVADPPLDDDPLALGLPPLLLVVPDDDPLLDVAPLEPLLLVPSPVSLPLPNPLGVLLAALHPSVVAPASAQIPTTVAIFIVTSIRDVQVRRTGKAVDIGRTKHFTRFLGHELCMPYARGDRRKRPTLANPVFSIRTD